MKRRLVTVLLPLLAACASTSYSGLALPTNEADSDMNYLVRRAGIGDKRAQLDLGIRYEQGLGVSIDLKRAESFYRAAASDSGGLLWIYLPAMSKGARSSVMPLNLAPKRLGLDEAKRRLRALQCRKTEIQPLQSSDNCANIQR